MLSMVITIDANEFETYLDERIAKLSDSAMTVLLNGPVMAFLSDRVSKRFASGGDAASGSWEPVSSGTMENRKVNTSSTPLIDSGTLRAWAENPTGTIGATAGGVAILDYPSAAPSDSITNYKYLMAQFGIDNTYGRQGVRTPARPIFAVDGIDLSGIMLILFSHIMT